jgi:site-specific DNA-methyltransferase (adenine-specific)
LTKLELNRIVFSDALQALKGLPSNTFNVGVTSPPYNKGEKDKGWLVDKVKYNGACDAKEEELYQQEQIDVLNELYRVTKPGGSFFYNHKLRWLKGRMIHPYSWVSQSNWVVRQEIIWHRKIAATIRGWRFWQTEERIFWLYKAVGDNFIGEELESRHARLSSVWQISPERKSPHPAPFPIELPARCIFSVLNGKKGNVIDPYAGSGTTLVAAKLFGLDWLGIEISEDYKKMAEERIANAELERHRFEKELSLHVIRKTFNERKENGEWVGRFRKNGEEQKETGKLW